MIDLASRATHDVNLPSPRQTRARIIKSFKQQMVSLKERLNVSFPFSAFVTRANAHSLEPCRGRRDQLDMRCMAS